MKKVLLTLTVIVAGLSVTALDINAQNQSRPSRLQQDKEKWHQEMEEFKARSAQRQEINALADSLAGVQAAAAVRNKDFVLEANQVTFKNGNTVFVKRIYYVVNHSFAVYLYKRFGGSEGKWLHT